MWILKLHRKCRLTIKLVLKFLFVILSLSLLLVSGLLLCKPPDPERRRVLPQCVIIGVRKCGTRALLEFLNHHTGLKVNHKELHFFDVDENYNKGLEWYRQQMPKTTRYQLTLTKTPSYFVSETAPARIHFMNSSMRLLVVVRDPVARMISDYSQIIAKKNYSTDLPKFEDLALRPTKIFPSGINERYKALKVSLYHEHMKNWLNHFNRTQIHIVDGDAFLGDPASELSKVETFLGIEHQLNHDMFFLDSSRGIYCSKSKSCLGDSKGRKHPTVPQTVVDKLCHFFKPHNMAFFEMVGQKFNSWC